MSIRRKVSHFLALVVIAALAVGLMAGPASAKMSSKHKAQIRHQLAKQVKKNPKVVMRRSFLKKAALVDFKLPVTLRLRGGNTNGGCNGFSVAQCQPNAGVIPGGTNPNKATVDLGPSLGQREVDLGGKLAAQIVFHDSFDGGALGNVDLEIRPSNTKTLTSTSIPLLWNTQVTDPATHYEANDLYLPEPLSGCGNFASTSVNNAVVSGPNIPFAAGYQGPGGVGLPGYPYSSVPGPTIVGFLPINPGINDTQDVTKRPRAGTMPGNNDIVGGAVNPFPSGSGTGPGGFVPTAADTVLRTNALSLKVATPGTTVNQSTGTGPTGSQDMVIGKSGGQANLFGNIPGKSYGIDVTVSLATRINSIIRAVDQDSFHTGLYTGLNWPAGVFNCQQIWTGGVDNYIPDVRLTGNLKIAPGLTSDGHLRIAKATVASQAGYSARFAVAACLMPNTTYAARLANPAVPAVGGPNTPSGGVAGPSVLPVDNTTTQAAPAADCNTGTDSLVTNSALAPATVTSLTGASTLNGFTTTNDGSKVSVGADLNVQNVSIDVLIGDV